MKWNCILVFVVLLFNSCKQDLDSIDKQLITESQAIRDYIAGLNTSEYVLYASSGIAMVIHYFGDGIPPHSGERVVFNYTGRFLSTNKIFESGVFNDIIDNITIAGLAGSIATLTEGSSATVYIPSLYAFGTKGSATVPANTTVIYDITLGQVVKTKDEQTQFNADTAAIHNYITSKNISNAVMHRTGIWYTVDNVGSGVIRPNVYSYVDIFYKAIQLSDSTIFTTDGLQSTSIINMIDGFKIGVPMMTEGGEFTFYVPSGLAYGTSSANGFSANSNLIFKVKLNTIRNN